MPFPLGTRSDTRVARRVLLRALSMVPLRAFVMGMNVSRKNKQLTDMLLAIRQMSTMIAKHMSTQTGRYVNTDRRIDTLLAGIVDKGFELNFSHGFRDAGAFLRTHRVPAKVIVRVINYGAHRTLLGLMPLPEVCLVSVEPIMMNTALNAMAVPGHIEIDSAQIL